MLKVKFRLQMWFIYFRGPPEATRQAHALITALVSDPDKELVEIIPKVTNKQPPQKESMYFTIDTSIPITSCTVSTVQSTVVTSSTRSSGGGRSGSRSQLNSNVRLATLPASIGVWGGPPNQTTSITSPRRNQQKTSSSVPPGTNPDKTVTRQLFPLENKKPLFSNPPSTSTNNSLTYTFASSSSKVTTSPSPVFSVSKSEMPRSPGPGMVKVLQRPTNQKNDHQPLPIVSNQQQSMSNGPVQSTSSPHGTFSPFNNAFSNVADQFLVRRDESVERMNFASVAAAGVVGSMVNSPMSENPGIPGQVGVKSDAALQAKAPGYRPSNIRPMTPQELEASRLVGFAGIQPVKIGVGEIELSRAPGYRMPNHSPGMSPRNQGELSPPSHSMNSNPSQPRKDEYTTANQPLTLPKIESTLNPNAPDFTSRQPGQLPGQNIPPAMYLQYLAQLINQPGKY